MPLSYLSDAGHISYERCWYLDETSLDVEYLTTVADQFRRFAGGCGAVEADDVLAWHLIRYADSMSARTVNRQSSKAVPIYEYLS